MTEAPISTPRDTTTIPQPLSDAQVGNAVATKFLNEVHQAMTGPADNIDTFNAQQNAWDDLSNLKGDPQQGAALNAIANKIESHDPSLGILQGNVERDKNGNITGFSFTNAQNEAAYAQSLNNYEAQGHTLQEAIAADGTNFLDQANIKGVLDMPSTGVVGGTSTDNGGPATPAPTDSGPGLTVAPSAPDYNSAPPTYQGTITIPG